MDPKIPFTYVKAALIVVAAALVVYVAAGMMGSVQSTAVINIAATEGSTELVEIPAGREIVLVQRHGEAERLCMGRGPDLGMTISEGMSFGAVGEAIEENESITETDLGGRTETVLLAREILYRACEIGLNHNTDLDQTRQLYHEALQAITALARGEAAPGPLTASGGETRPE